MDFHPNFSQLLKMQQLSNILAAERMEEFTKREIHDLVREYHAATDWPLRAKIGFYLDECLQRGKINPDRLLITAIPRVTTFHDLIPIRLALKAGANRNMYIMTPGVGRVHLLIFAVTTLRAHRATPRALDLVLLLLVLSGSHSSAHAFDQNSELLEGSCGQGSTSSRYPAGDRSPGSVQRWLVSQGLNPMLDIMCLLDHLRRENPRDAIALGTIADRVDLIPPAGSVPNFRLACMARATNILQTYQVSPESPLTSYDRGTYLGLREAIDLYSLDGYVRLMDLGYLPTYFTMNQLVMGLKVAGQVRDRATMGLVQAMLQESISRGISLDLEQLAVISNTSESIAQVILQQYQQPLWIKACTIPRGPVPEPLQRLAFNLGLKSNDKGLVCQQLQQLSEADPSALKSAAVRRQRLRVSTNVSTLTNFVGSDRPPLAVCQNRTTLQQDPYLYGDVTMAYYQDAEGLVWCFTSDNYEALIANRTNPYKAGGELLPLEFIDELRLKLRQLRRLKINVSQPVASDVAIDALTQVDLVTNAESEAIVAAILSTAAYAGITTLGQLSPEQMFQALSAIMMEQRYLELMTPNHRLITFCRAADFVLQQELSLTPLWNIVRMFPMVTRYAGCPVVPIPVPVAPALPVPIRSVPVASEIFIDQTMSSPSVYSLEEEPVLLESVPVPEPLLPGESEVYEYEVMPVSPPICVPPTALSSPVCVPSVPSGFNPPSTASSPVDLSSVPSGFNPPVYLPSPANSSPVYLPSPANSSPVFVPSVPSGFNPPSATSSPVYLTSAPASGFSPPPSVYVSSAPGGTSPVSISTLTPPSVYVSSASGFTPPTYINSPAYVEDIEYQTFPEEDLPPEPPIIVTSPQYLPTPSPILIASSPDLDVNTIRYDTPYQSVISTPTTVAMSPADFVRMTNSTDISPPASVYVTSAPGYTMPEATLVLADEDEDDDL
jgi:hypothetical protein